MSRENAVQAAASSVRFGDVDWSRDIALNLIRFMATAAVLLTYSYALSIGQRDVEPLRTWLGTTPATVAVDVFFLVSGFLVTVGLQCKPSVRGCLMARALRLLPACWCCCSR